MSILFLLWSLTPQNLFVKIYILVVSVMFLGFFFRWSWLHRSFAYELWTKPIKLFVLPLIVVVVFATGMAAGDFMGSRHSRLETEVRFYFKNKESPFHDKAFTLLRYNQGSYYVIDGGECSAKDKCVRIVPESEIEMAVVRRGAFQVEEDKIMKEKAEDTPPSPTSSPRRPGASIAPPASGLSPPAAPGCADRAPRRPAWWPAPSP
jgi:hypothetical protein